MSSGGGGVGGDAPCPAATITLGQPYDLELLGEATFQGIVGEPGGFRFSIAAGNGAGLGLYTFEVAADGTSIAPLGESYNAPAGVAITSSTDADQWLVWIAEDEGVQRCQVDSVGTVTCDPFTFELVSGVTGIAVGDDVYASVGATPAFLAKFDLLAPNAGDELTTFTRASKVLTLSEGQLVFNASRDGDGGGGAGPVSSLELCNPAGCENPDDRPTMELGGTLAHAVLKDRNGVLEAYAIAGDLLVRGIPSLAGGVATPVGDGTATALAREGDHLLVGIDSSLRACCLTDGPVTSTDACVSVPFAEGEQVRAIQPLSASRGIVIVTGGSVPLFIPYTLD